MIEGFGSRLLTWFDQHGRKDLPWQTEINPYRVWVSEIMLQQTQVTTVVPYHERFMSRFPTVESLAQAAEDEVLHYWTGLGYYARARNLHKAARILADEYQSQFPSRVEELEKLPGIGRSTAGAIVAIACGERAAILDGNVKRVLARYFGIEGWPGETGTARALWEKAEMLTPAERVADYTQAIMDLGATVCIRTSPKCGACPLNADCIAFQTGDIQRYPGKKPKKQKPEKSTCMLMIENPDGELLLEKRPNQGIWGGLWSFPECQPDNINDALANLALPALDSNLATRNSQLETFRHTFTHFHLDITPVHVQLSAPVPAVGESNRLIWYSPDAPRSIGLAGPVTKLIAQLR